MEITLPRFRRSSRKILVKSPIASTSYQETSSKQQKWSYITLTLASFCLFLIIVFGSQNGFGFISPVSSFLDPLTLFSQEERTYKTFGYIPGWSDTKYDDVVLDEMDILAFYDLPVKADGSIDEDAKGHTKFHSDAAKALFQRAHAHEVEVVVTLSQYSNASIERILDSKEAQDRLIQSAIDEVIEEEIDGVVLDFAYEGDDSSYGKKYTEFVSKFNEAMEVRVPGGQVNVAFTGKAEKQPFYDLAALQTVSDNFLVSMESVALLEEKGSKVTAPLYSHNEKAYWEDVSNALKDVSHYFAQENVALEMAWYGNGDQYPMYKPVPGKTLPNAPKTNTLSTPLSDEVIDELIAQVPAKGRASVRKNIPYIAKALEDEGYLTGNVLAYALATIEHETAGTFEPIDEIGGMKSARRLGYEGGNNYYGRGFIQLTHLRNYKVMGERIGMGDKLARNPELASDPEVAAKILAAFFVDNGPAKLARSGNFIAARRPVNPDAHAYNVANMAMKYKPYL